MKSQILVILAGLASFASLHAAAPTFEALDINHDGSISPAEYAVLQQADAAVAAAAAKEKADQLEAWSPKPHEPLPPSVQNDVANGSMSSNQSGGGDIRRALIEADLVDCMVALPGQLFYSTQIQLCLSFSVKSKEVPTAPGQRRPRVYRRRDARL